jgi:8-oxo-dGTP pyrophosphatase MutT (NUDIX family)
MSLGVGDRGEPFIHIEGDGVFVVPITENNEVLMIVEPSITEREPVLGLPAGTVEPGESSQESANRELQEESGYKSQKLDFLGTISPLARHSDMIIDVYLGRKLVPSRLEGDEAYDIEVHMLPFAEIEGAIMAGRFNDSNVISALYLARIFLENEKKLEK